ncbi:MAG: SagB/ThcOx family dehydrogenase [Candidatus Omnitrophica bacterium]|nr:SagB/ThcOx family dehydrogenase [Candidatus Omnitrophota bacterium]
MAQSNLSNQAKQIQLPQPDRKGKVPLEETIVKRRSQRTFLQTELTLKQIGQLLWAAQGATGRRDDIDLRAVPSAGATYPMELYLLTPEGLFHYVPEGHCLEVVKKEDLRASLSAMTFRQEIVKFAPMTMVITAVYSRVTSKYGERGRMYAHMEAGHIAQNVHLQAVALGLSSVPMGAFDEEKVKELLSLPADREPLYMVPVGYAD